MDRHTQIRFQLAEGGLQRFSGKTQRGDGSKFLSDAFARPYVIGYLRCQYIDRPARFGRGLRQGLLRDDGQPREGFTSFFLRSATGEGFPHLRWHPAQAGMLFNFFGYVKWKWQECTPEGPTSNQSS